MVDVYKTIPNPKANAATSPPWASISVAGAAAAAAECEEFATNPDKVEVEDE
jgi:hypothetical protein